MEAFSFLFWFGLAFALLVTEVLTGTIFLLLAGIACMAAAVLAVLGAAPWVQLLGFSIMALIGYFIVWKRKLHFLKPPQNAPVSDVGNSVIVEEVSRTGDIRVRYRGTQWPAIVRHATPRTPELALKQHAALLREIKPGDILVISGMRDNALICMYPQILSS